VAELEAAIATVTSALGRTADETIELLVTERAAMRAELRALKAAETGNVVVLDVDRR
jgi:hypothetical protein